MLPAQQDNGHAAAQGRWFTADPQAVEWYRRDCGPTACVFAVEIPTSDLDRYRVSNCEDRIGRDGRTVRMFSKDPKNEFFLPRELAETRRQIDWADVEILADVTPAPALRCPGLLTRRHDAGDNRPQHD